MLCNGYYALVNATFFNTSTNTKNISGSNTTLENSYSSFYSFSACNDNYMVSNGSGYSFYVGAGTTEPQVTDYCLENPINKSSLSYTDIFKEKYFDSNGKLVVRLSRQFTNVTNERITISELAVTFGKGSGYPILLAREVLDLPITVEPGESVVLQANLF